MSENNFQCLDSAYNFIFPITNWQANNGKNKMENNVEQKKNVESWESM